MGAGAWFVAGRLATYAVRGVRSAIEAAKESFRSGPTLSSAEQYVQDGADQLRAGRIDAAKESFNRALAWDEKLIPAWWGKGVTALASDELDDAAACAKQITAIDPRNSIGFGLLAMAMGLMKRYDEALGAARSAHRLEPHNRTWIGAIGAILLELSCPMEALRYFRMAVSFDPAYATALVGAADAHNMLGRPRRALEVANRVLTKQSLDINALRSASTALAQMKRYDEARAKLAKAKELLVISKEARDVSGFSFSPQRCIDEECAEMAEMERIYVILPRLFAVPRVRSIRFGRSSVTIFLTRNDPRIQDDLKSLFSQHSNYSLRFEVLPFFGLFS